MKLTDAQLDDMLKRIQQKNYRHKKSRNLEYMFDTKDTVFERIGFVKEDGGRLSVEEFKSQFGNIKRKHINYFYELLNDMLKRNYGKRALEQYKENMIIGYEKIGQQEVAQKIRGLSNTELRKRWRTGEFDNFRDKYEIHIADRIAGDF